MENVIWILLVLIVVALAAVLYQRWKHVTKKRLSDAKCHEIATDLCDEIFSLAGQPLEYVRFDGTALSESIGRFQVIELLRWMNGRGYSRTGQDWDWIQILLGEFPRWIALSQREYDARKGMAGSSNIIVGDGSINIHGIQMVAGNDINTDSDFLVRLVHAIRSDAEALDINKRAEALQVADTVAAAAEGDLSKESALFKNAIKWIKQRVNEGVSGAVGAGLWAATAELFL